MSQVHIYRDVEGSERSGVGPLPHVHGPGETPVDWSQVHQERKRKVFTFRVWKLFTNNT